MSQTNRTTMPPMQPVQLSLGMAGSPSAIDEAWAAHRNSLPGMSLGQALERPLIGRLLRAHAASIERMRRRTIHRRTRRQQT